jgi:predicted TIM-barrel fold metal-dependent hydrolase
VVGASARRKCSAVPVFFNAIADDFPDVNIIMGRMGLQYDNASAVVIAKNHSNIYLDTSAAWISTPPGD